MALGRWWKPFARKNRPEPDSTDRGEGDASVPATAPAPMTRRPMEAAPAAATMPAAIGPAESPKPVDVPLSDPQRIEFFRWIVGVPAIAGTSGLPDLVVQHLMERLDEVIASDALRATLLPRAPHVIPQLMKTLRDEGYSSAAVASRIPTDVVLTAEAVRG